MFYSFIIEPFRHFCKVAKPQLPCEQGGKMTVRAFADYGGFKWVGLWVGRDDKQRRAKDDEGGGEANRVMGGYSNLGSPQVWGEIAGLRQMLSNQNLATARSTYPDWIAQRFHFTPVRWPHNWIAPWRMRISFHHLLTLFKGLSKRIH